MADTRQPATTRPRTHPRQRRERKNTTLRFSQLFRMRRVSGSPLLSAVSLPLMLLYHEVLLRLFDWDSNFFSMGLLRIFLK